MFNHSPRHKFDSRHGHSNVTSPGLPFEVFEVNAELWIEKFLEEEFFRVDLRRNGLLLNLREKDFTGGSNPGCIPQNLSLAWTVSVNHRGNFRPGADERQVAEQKIDELGEFVEGIFA